MKGQVIDFRTRRNLTQAAAQLDSAVAQKGTYVGVLPKGEAQAIRDTMKQLEDKRTDIDLLVNEFDSLWTGYGFMLLGAMGILGIDFAQYEPEAYDLHVDVKGHCWMMPRDLQN